MRTSSRLAACAFVAAALIPAVASAAAPDPDFITPHISNSDKLDLPSFSMKDNFTQEIELLPGVQETLPALAERHRLILMTKGNPEEQSQKLARSGLGEYFTAVEIPHEKNPEAYQTVCTRHSLSCDTTWMIGNSPRSDINPAMAAGINAVFVPHDNTWILEHETLNAAPAGVRLLQVERFAELKEHF